MSDSRALAAVRAVHTAIYLVMASATLVLLFAGLTGTSGWWLWVALALLGVESAVFIGNGFRCPLTAMAVRYGAVTGHVFDTYLPEKATRYTFRFFGTLMVIGLVLVALRWAAAIG